MSHIVHIQTEVRDADAVALACERLALPPPVERTVTLFNGCVTGLAIELSGWKYPAVCDLRTGQLAFDNYGGAWGDQKELHRFVQRYAVEKARIEARKVGHLVIEQSLPDGSIKLTIELGGAA